jgi:rRNA maturation RNase YbeY
MTANKSISIALNQINLITPNFSIEKFVKAFLDLLKIKSGHFEFTFLLDEAMIQLHDDYLNSATTTDIVTFNLNTEEEPEGDIYICIDEAKRNAKKLKHSIDTELKFLLAHGLLHLIGYNDTDEQSKKIMFNEQQRLIDILEESYEISK